MWEIVKDLLNDTERSFAEDMLEAYTEEVDDIVVDIENLADIVEEEIKEGR